MAQFERRGARVVVSALLGVSFLCAATRGVEFAGGTGEPNDPYQIATAEQLLSIETDPELRMNAHYYALVASIDLEGTVRSRPVISFFRGVLDGKGHAIRNLRIETGRSQGLVAFIDREAEIRNLGVVDVYITSTGRPGGLATVNLGRVHNCVTGTVSGSDTTGGLVGENSGIITDSYSAASVTGGHAGGLVGSNMGTILSCYATGKITGEDRVGGLVGTNDGRIETSYSATAVYCYGWHTGGLAGQLFSPEGRVEDCYFLTQWDGGGPDNGVGTALTDAEMRQQASFAGWDFWGTAADWALDLWYMPEDAYPVLVWQVLQRVPDEARPSCGRRERKTVGRSARKARARKSSGPVAESHGPRKDFLTAPACHKRLDGFVSQPPHVNSATSIRLDDTDVVHIDSAGTIRREIGLITYAQV